MTPPLVIYIQAQLAAGFPRAAIQQALVSSGWTEREIAEAFADATKPLRAPSRLPPPKQLSSGKIPLAITLAVVSSAYATWQYLGGGESAAANIAAATTTPGAATVVSSLPVATSTVPAATSSTPTQPAGDAPKPKKTGQYADGSYTGAVADAFYGTVQVEAVVQDGKLADVKFLQYPTDRPASRLINDEAMPLLIQEAITAQSAQVDTASGATFTSEAFRESLASALVLAEN